MMNMGKKEVRERLAMLGDVSQTQKSNSQHHRLSSISSSPQENSLPSASFTPNSTNLIHTAGANDAYHDWKLDLSSTPNFCKHVTDTLQDEVTMTLCCSFLQQVVFTLQACSLVECQFPLAEEQIRRYQINAKDARGSQVSNPLSIDSHVAYSPKFSGYAGAYPGYWLEQMCQMVASNSATSTVQELISSCSTSELSEATTAVCDSIVASDFATSSFPVLSTSPRVFDRSSHHSVFPSLRIVGKSDGSSTTFPIGVAASANFSVAQPKNQHKGSFRIAAWLRSIFTGKVLSQNVLKVRSQSKAEATLGMLTKFTVGNLKLLISWVSQADLTVTNSKEKSLYSSLAGSTGDKLNQRKAENLIPARRHRSFASFGARAAQAWSVNHFWLWEHYLAAHVQRDFQTSTLRQNKHEPFNVHLLFSVRHQNKEC